MNRKPTMTEITLETRHEANESVPKQKRYNQILEILDEMGEATAKEIAVRMCEKGFVNSTERNWAAPRLSEMEWIGRVETVGKKKCAYTGKTVAVYRRSAQ